MRVSFSDILHAKYFNKTINVKCIVSGKSVSPYSVPRKIKITCDKGGNACLGEDCPLHKDGIIKLTADDHLLHFIDISENQFGGILKKLFGLRCKFSYEVISVQNIERIFISAPTGKERIKNVSSYVCYYLGYGLEINTIYELVGYTTTDPSSQTSTCIFTESNKLKTDVESFALTSKIKDKLNAFVVPKPSAMNIFAALEDIYKYYALNVTKIYNRFHLHIAIDLVFRSVISFRFDNELVHKGWLDIMVIGDTRCGKGYVAEKLVKHFDVGEVISGDNTSFAGLIGGLQQYNGHWVTTWGKIPMNDQGLVIIDEAGEIKPEEWSRLSRVRSEGVAEIAKIHKQITNARTRLISLANPPLKTIASYSYGIQALKDVVKAPEDIARFDYALVVSHDEVSVKDINQSRPEMSELYPQELEQQLILWAWSRKQNQIQFSPEAVKACYKYAVDLSKNYSFTIPLIQGENVRIKLAKIAVCFAARVYSNIENGKILYVEHVHMECAHLFLNMIYKLDANGYYHMSQLQKTVDVGANENNLKKIDKYFSTFINSRDRLCKCLLNNNRITVTDLVEHLNQPREIATEIISKLLDLNLIVKTYHSQYEKTPSFNAWLRKTVLAITIPNGGSSR